MEKIKKLIKDQNWQEADQAADEVLSMISAGEKK